MVSEQSETVRTARLGVPPAYLFFNSAVSLVPSAQATSNAGLWRGWRRDA
jgi:hypothetical protein